MKKSFFALFLSFMLVAGFSSSAFAELFSVSAGVPLNYNFTEKTDGEKLSADGMPKGQLVHVKLPIMIGLGLEKYEQNIDDKNGFQEGKMEMQMFDIFYLLPIPVVNITLGAGVGSVEYKIDDDNNWDSSKGTATQVYAQVGLPIFVVADIHVSYHRVNGKSEIEHKATGAKTDVNMGGEMYALGISVGF